MSELRFDPINNQWVAIADNRAERPNEFQRLLTRKEPVVCPFCAGNESATPPELMTVPHGDKRQDLKKRDMQRQIDRTLAGR